MLSKESHIEISFIIGWNSQVTIVKFYICLSMFIFKFVRSGIMFIIILFAESILKIPFITCIPIKILNALTMDFRRKGFSKSSKIHSHVPLVEKFVGLINKICSAPGRVFQQPIWKVAMLRVGPLEMKHLIAVIIFYLIKRRDVWRALLIFFRAWNRNC